MLDESRILWRVGYFSDPLGYPPSPQYNHRFDDSRQQFRSMYAAELQETALREVLTDVRPSAKALAAYVAVFGPGAAADVPGGLVTEVWRQRNVLAPVYLDLDGPLIDLTDHMVLHELEVRHAAALAAVDMDHLDLHELTTRVRAVTQQIATDVYERLGAAAIRFPSSRDGNVCFAVFEGRGKLASAGDPVLLTDPPPESLRKVAASWNLELEAASPIASRSP